jgi:hypothetical protein
VLPVAPVAPPTPLVPAGPVAPSVPLVPAGPAGPAVLTAAVPVSVKETVGETWLAASAGMVSVAVSAPVADWVNRTCTVQFIPSVTVQSEQKSWSATTLKSALPVTATCPTSRGSWPVVETVNVFSWDCPTATKPKSSLGPGRTTT